MKTVLNRINVNTLDEPLFLGKDLSLQRYDRPKYPKFLDLWKDQLGFFWRPEEISLIKDRNDYESLDETERFVFDNNLRWQTMVDSMLSRSIHNMSQYVSNPELEIAMTAWSHMETIHSYSYTYILNNVLKEPSKFFDSILEDKEIVSRAEAISSSYDKLLGKTSNIKQDIFDAVVSTQITEGLAFYVSFACSFYFGYRGKMEGNAKIIKMIARDENLHVAITSNILKVWRENKSEGFQQLIKDNKSKVEDMYGLAAQNEKNWTKYLFSRGALLGLNENTLNGYVEWLANNRLTSNGFDKIFSTTQNPIGNWLTSYTDSSKVQNAPQETEITAYKIGSRDVSGSASEISDIEL